MERTLITPRFREIGNSGVFVANGPSSYDDSLRALYRERLEMIGIEELPYVIMRMGPHSREALFDLTFFCSNGVIGGRGELRWPGVLPMTDWYMSPKEAFSMLFSERKRREMRGAYDDFVLIFRCSVTLSIKYHLSTKC